MLKALLLTFSVLLPFAACTPRVDSVEPRSFNFLRTGRQISVNFVLFDPKAVDLIVIDNGHHQETPRYRNLKEALIANRCIAGTNGGFFDGNFAPQGLMIASGTTTGVLEPKSWMKGVFMIRNEELALQELAEGVDIKGATQFLQAGPWLVKMRHSESGFLNDAVPQRRSFIGRSEKGRWILGCCDSATLHELAELLRDARVVRLIDIESALNLDGGPSTGYWMSNGFRSKYVAEEWAVRNFLGVRPKK